MPYSKERIMTQEEVEANNKALQESAMTDEKRAEAIRRMHEEAGGHSDVAEAYEK